MQVSHPINAECHPIAVIARVWHGRTPVEKSEEYLRFLIARAVPDYRSVAGNRGVSIMRRNEGGATHFVILTAWESRAAIEGFAGADIETTKYYPEDQDFLLEFEPHVRHYELTQGNEYDRLPTAEQPK
jgi:heme-degrading monooxygenase HmoA